MHSHSQRLGSPSSLLRFPSPHPTIPRSLHTNPRYSPHPTSSSFLDPKIHSLRSQTGVPYLQSSSTTLQVVLHGGAQRVPPPLAAERLTGECAPPRTQGLAASREAGLEPATRRFTPGRKCVTGRPGSPTLPRPQRRRPSSVPRDSREARSGEWCGASWEV